MKWEFTREEQFIGATTRHQMTTRVKLGAKRDGTLTAIEIQVISNTGAYGNHASETLAAALGNPLTVYRCANKKAIGYAVYTNMVPGGGFRGYGSSQIDLRDRVRDGRAGAAARDGPVRDPPQEHGPAGRLDGVGVEGPVRRRFRQLRARPVPRPGREGAWPRAAASRKPDGDEWAEGTGIALAMLDCGPPTEHRAGAQMALLPDGTYHLAVGSTEMGNGSVTSHRQIAASILGARADSVAIINADTDLAPYDTGTFASTGTVVAGQAVALAAEALRDNILDFASRHTGIDPAACRLDDDAVICGNSRSRWPTCMRPARKAGHRFEAKRKAYLSPRTVAFNVQGVRLAVHRVTGEIRILHSVHAADIGRLINPMQCRGQIDGAIGMGFGWALTEKMVYDARHHGEPVVAQLPHPRLRRRAAHRGVLRRHLRHDRPARREVAGRVRDQSGRTRHRQRPRGRDRRALPASAVHAGSHLHRSSTGSHERNGRLRAAQHPPRRHRHHRHADARAAGERR